MKKEVSLMFSGGVDSTIAAIKLAEKFERVNLLNYNNGYGHYNFENAEKRYEELQKRIGNKFFYYHFSVKDIFGWIIVNNLLEDYEKYKSAFIWCLGCKMAMHAKSILFNLKKGVKYMADGSSKYSEEFVEQMPISISALRNIYRDYGIKYINPGFGIEREKKIAILKEKGFRMGIRIRDRFLGVQPKCIHGELYYMPGVLFNRFPNHCKKDVYRFINDKKKIIDEYIKNGMLQSKKTR